MNQNTCKTCKWWKWNNDLGFTTGSGEFIPWSTPLIQFVCGGTGQWKAADGMVDAEDYGGVLTGPDFGCIHYTETQEQLPQDHPGYAAQQARTPKGIKETEVAGFKIVCSCDSGPVSECLIHASPQEICPACKNPLRSPGQTSVELTWDESDVCWHTACFDKMERFKQAQRGLQPGEIFSPGL